MRFNAKCNKSNLKHILFSWSLTTKGVTMRKHYPKLESVSKVIETLPHPQSKSIAKAIRVCNDKKTDLPTKLCAVAFVFI